MAGKRSHLAEERLQEEAATSSLASSVDGNHEAEAVHVKSLVVEAASASSYSRRKLVANTAGKPHRMAFAKDELPAFAIACQA